VTSSKLQVASKSRWQVFLLLLAACHLLLLSCGFHLRGAGMFELSPALAKMRVMVEGSQLQNEPLLVAMKSALRFQTNIQVEDSGDAPLLLLYGERSENQLLSVISTGKAEAYLLKYEVSFRLIDKENKPLSEPQTVRVRRDHAYDRLNILSSEREEQELRREMQRDAVQQILRRLSRINPEARHADQR